MKVLLVYEEIPENMKFVVLSEPTETELAALAQANGKVINCDDENEGMEYLSNAIASKPEYAREGAKEACAWKDCLITADQLPTAGPFDKVFWSGFAMQETNMKTLVRWVLMAGIVLFWLAVYLVLLPVVLGAAVCYAIEGTWKWANEPAVVH